jgi:aminoglycoside phosphotransferase family enzyme/predicted kinase
MALPDSLEALLSADAYPHPCGPIELIETHISWVILTGEFAYKLKKPVSFNFVDFSTLTRREHFCREEVRCNRSFAPALYLDVVPVTAEEGMARVATAAETAGRTEVLEWAVKMRQFDPQAGLDRMLERGELAQEQLRQFGTDLARAHAALPAHRGTAEEVPLRMFGPVEDNFSEISRTELAAMFSEDLDQALAAARTLAKNKRRAFDERMVGGAVRECHGDLHLSNLALIDGVVTAFDCLEFNENLRWIDTMSDVAFLFMDCHCRGEIGLAYGFLDGYLDASGDYVGVRLLSYFAAYRSVVRAKVAALRWVQAPDEETAERFGLHLRWARRWLERPPGRLVLTCGLSGSGKSHLAGRLLGTLPALRLRSDVARKTLAGLGSLDKSDSPVDGGLYAPQQSDRTFGFLAETTRALLEAGEHVIVDATFIEQARRDEFLTLAREVGTHALILFCDAPRSVLETRLADRSAAGGDPSEADVTVLHWQLDRFEPPGEDEPVLGIDTSAPLTDSVIDDLVRQILA